MKATTMLVYGIRCAPDDLSSLPKQAIADYYLDYGLLVFPIYTAPLCLRGQPSATLWNSIKDVVERAGDVVNIDMENPWISEEEGELVKIVQTFYPGRLPSWYSVPRVVC